MAICCASSLALAAGPHAHGVASLDVALAGAELTLSLRSPLENYVGFERAPRNEKETAAVRAAAAALRDGSAFSFPSAAGCSLAQAKLSSDVLPAALLGEAESTNADRTGRGEHADLDGEYVYRCSNAAALDAFEVRLFDRFKRLERINVQVAGPKKQTAVKLTPRARRVPLK